MGTTVAAVHFHHDNITVSHIGDSRVYRLRNGDFEQITVDHSLRMYLVEQGFYTPEEAEKEVAKNVVSRALGIEPSVEGDIQTLQAQSQDIYLICSDGLTDMVNDDALHNILTDSQTDLKEAAQAMLKAANDNGGKDNISVILARVPEASATQEARGRAKLEFVGVSDVGRKRSHNEDSIPFNAALGLAVLADGMGGYNAGDAASAIAVKMIMDAYLEQCQSEMPDLNTQTTSIIAAEVDGLLGGIRNNEPAPERQGPRGSSVQQDYDKLRQLFDLDFPDTQVEQINLGEDTERNTEQQRPDESLKAATSLKVGDWVEFCHPDEKMVRGRITWISPDTGKFLFTDPKGTKVAESTPFGLAAELRAGSAIVIKDAPLFDRIINNMNHFLKKGIGVNNAA